MKLSIPERIMLMGILPKRGSYKEMKASTDFMPKLFFNEEEVRKYDISYKNLPDGRFEVTFNEEVSTGYTVDVKIPAMVSSIIASKLKEMDANREIDDKTIGLYEKFVL